jgi:hypothetical protein
MPYASDSWNLAMADSRDPNGSHKTYETYATQEIYTVPTGTLPFAATNAKLRGRVNPCLFWRTSTFLTR